MTAPAVPPTAAPMIAPFAVDPFARPTIPPTAAPDAAPMIAPVSFLFSDAHPLAETTVARAGMSNNERCILDSCHEVTSVDEHTRLGDTGFPLADASTTAEPPVIPSERRSWASGSESTARHQTASRDRHVPSGEPRAHWSAQRRADGGERP